jgi:hypothetical protein
MSEMTGLIQGTDAVLSFYKDSYLPYVCATDIAVSLTAGKLPVRTVKDGHWKKFTYQDLSYTVTLSGLLKFDDANFTGWDLWQNQLGFVQVQFQVTFTDDQNNVRSIRGQAMVETTTTNINVGALVKQDFSLQGSGAMIIFDGIVPCDSAITGITFSGTDSGAGDVTVNYTYTGSPYQVKYRLNGTGDWFYVIVSGSISIPGMAIGDYDIEIIPVCTNNFEGDGATASFTVTHALSCSSTITGITISPEYVATYTYTGTPTNIRYRIDGGVWVILAIGSSINLASQGLGPHTLDIDPICPNGIVGTGASQSFTISAQPAQSTIAYNLTRSGPFGILQIFVNGTLYVNQTTTGSGSIVAPTGASIRASFQVSSGGAGGDMSLITLKDGSSIDSRTTSAPATLEYIFTTADGSAYQINASLI